MKANKRKQQVNTKKIIIVLIIVVLVLFAAYLGLRYLRSKINERFASKETGSAKTAEVTVGSISTTVYGKGSLSNLESDTLTLPATVEVTRIYVSSGDSIEKGDLLASVNASTVLQAMAEKQTEIETVDRQIAEISAGSLSETVTAAVSGRVKAIYAAVGDDVTEIMVENGALLLLSMDGCMSLSLETDELKKKDSVTVTDAYGTAYEGSVASIAGGIATILLSDDGPEADTLVKVTDKDGKKIGSARLAIHEPVTVTGFVGTVAEIPVSVNQAVAAGDILMKLTDVSYSANYETLLAKRETLEQELLDLLTVYREGGVYAHSAGTVTAVSKGNYAAARTGSSASSQSSGMSFGGSSSAGGSMSGMGSSGFSGGTASSGSTGSDTSISFCPSDSMQVTISVDETDILSLTVGQEVSVYISSLSEEEYKGIVTAVGTTGSSSGGVTTYSAVVELKKEKGMLAGMTAAAYVTIEGTDNALLLPVAALNETSTTAYVYTSYDEETDTLGGMVEVEIGLKNSRYAEIKSGLSEGDTVYYKEAAAKGNNYNFGGMSGIGGRSGGMNGMPSGGFSGMPSGGFSGMPSGGFSGFGGFGN